jgi:cytochrome c oxidase assembly protein subunit 19
MAAFGGSRGSGARPPEKGIFPLDHFGECKKVRVLCHARAARARRSRCRSHARPSSLPPPPHHLSFLQIVDAYRACLQERDADADRCQELAQRYLRCRMERSGVGQRKTGGRPRAAAAAAAPLSSEADATLTLLPPPPHHQNAQPPPPGT